MYRMAEISLKQDRIMTKEEYIKHVKNNELGNREPDIYDIEDAWVEGYNAAVEKAAEWLNTWQSDETNSYMVYGDIVDFKNAMEL